MNKHDFNTPSIESDTLEILSQKLLRTTAELMSANQKLERYQQERSEMLANISHDLRAPITAIRSALDLLNSKNDASAEDLWETLHLIDRRTSSLENLIQDMYLLFTAENPSSAFDFQEIEIAPFLEEYYVDLSLNPAYDAHKLELDLSPDLSALVRIDIQKFLRVLDNLFTNALKYSGDHTTILLRSFVNNEENMLEIDVEDNGIGIPPEAIDHIFDRTYTVSRARTPGKASGSGLGLCIVRTIIERFGGSVSCQSTYGEGCCFRILLPLFQSKD